MQKLQWVSGSVIDSFRFESSYRIDRNDVSLPSHCWTNGWQPLKNIVTNGWLTEKPSKNHWSQWLSRYHSINGNGHLKNHWFLAMVVNFLHLCLAEADIKQTNDSYWKILNVFCTECLEQDWPWLMSTSVFSCHICFQVSESSYLLLWVMYKCREKQKN